MDTVYRSVQYLYRSRRYSTGRELPFDRTNFIGSFISQVGRQRGGFYSSHYYYPIASRSVVVGCKKKKKKKKFSLMPINQYSTVRVPWLVSSDGLQSDEIDENKEGRAHSRQEFVFVYRF